MTVEALHSDYIDLFPFKAWVRVHWDRMEVKTRFFRIEIPYSELEGIGLVERIPWYVGRGVEPYPISRTLYVVDRRRNCVEIRKNSGFWRRLVLSVTDPETLIDVVRRYSGLESRPKVQP
ncbi:MAG: hypothetical protein ABDH63_05610 [Candidatus Caldarchaeales archaeon]